MTQTQSIADSIKVTGFTIRDWLGPYYTLGCLVALAIGFCAIVDPSGWLVRGVTGLLVVATLIAWCIHIARSRTPAVDVGAQALPGPKLHAILFAITLFFCVGLVISEFLLHGKHGSPPVPAAASDGSPQGAQPTTTVAQPTVPVSPLPIERPASPAALADTRPAVPAAAVSVPVASGASHHVQRASGHTDKADQRGDTRRAAALPASDSDDARRCSGLIANFSLGRNLSDADKRYLETSCR